MKRQRRKGTRKEYFRQCMRDYMREHELTEADPDDVSQWMIDTGRFSEAPLTPVKRCRQELVRHLREELAIDPQGREYRVNQAIPIKIKGQWKSLWGETFKLKPNRMRRSLTWRYRQLEGVVDRHHTDWASYNDNNIHGAQLPLWDYNLNLRIAEKDQPTEYPDEPPKDQDEESSS